MFSEMTVGQKLQAAVICVALGVSAYLVFANTRTHFDETVNSWPAAHQFRMDPSKPYDKAKNPYDPKKEEKLTVLACADGQIDFVEYPGDTDKHLKIVYRPDLRQAGKVFQYYHDPMLAVADIKDPYRHAMAYAVYLKLYRPEQAKSQGSALGAIQPPITQEQLAKEADARKVMDASISVMEAMVSAGTFHKDMLEPLEKTLKDFQTNQKDIISDKAKQDLARKLLTLASTYDRRIQESRSEAIDKYITAMETVLTEPQKESLIAVIAKREQKTTPVPTGRRGRGTTAAPNRSTNRGTSTAAPTTGRAGRGTTTTTAPARGRG